MKSTLKFGIATGLISCIFLFGFFLIGAWLNIRLGWGMQAGNIRGLAGLLSIPIQAIGIYMAMQDVKNGSNSLTYTQALKTGVIVALTIAVIVALFSFLFCVLLNPEYADFMVKDAQKGMISAGDSAEQIKKQSAEVAGEFTPGIQVMQALVGQFFMGTIMSLIIGLFVKTRNK